MNGGIVKKGMEAAIVIAAFIAAILVYKVINPEWLIKPDSTPVTAAEIASAAQKHYTGRVAGDGIERILGKEAFEDIAGNTYVTAEPIDLVATGVYGLNPWVDPYKITKIKNPSGRMVNSGRKAPEVTDNSLEAMEYYQEYYLLQLADESYIVAQFSKTYKEEIEQGKIVTLPIGIKKTNSNEVKQHLSDICETYGADSTYTLYMIDDEWQQEQEFTFFIIKFGAAAVIFLIVAVGLLVILYKIRD